VNQPLKVYPALAGVARVIAFLVHFAYNVAFVSKKIKIRTYEFINHAIFVA